MNENFNVYEHEEKHTCSLCGKETTKTVGISTDSWGATMPICDECGVNLFNRIQCDDAFREECKKGSY